MANENQITKIVVPWWPGPIDDEWDSGDYNDFWSLTERVINRRIIEARERGEQVKLVAPDDETD